MRNADTDFTRGSVGSNMLRLTVPMTLALLVNVLYSVVDRIYIGHIPGIGRLALTGIGLASPVIMLLGAFMRLCSVGAAPLFAIARGRGDAREAGAIQGNALVLLTGTALALTCVTLLVKEPLLLAIGASEETLPYADGYLKIYVLGTAFVYVSTGMNPFINAQGYPRVGMLTVMIGAFANIALDPLFIFALDMGVRGAAAASVIAQAVSAAWVLRFLTGRKAAVPLKKRDAALSFRRAARIFSLGVTGFTFSLTSSLVNMLYNAQLLKLGGVMWVSAMTVTNSIREFAFMPVQGITDGMQPFLGYNYGAGAYGRARRGIRLTTAACLAWMAAICAALMLFPRPFVRVFTDDEALLPYAEEGIRLFFCMSFMMAFQMAGQHVFVSLGRARLALTFSLLRKAVLVIPLTLVLPRLFSLGARGVFLSEPVSDVIGGACCYVTMRLTVGRELKERETGGDL